MILLDLSHTSHTRAQTGIQRVCRGLHNELQRRSACLPVTYDPYWGTWRPLQPWESDNLAATTTSQKRGAKWPLQAIWKGRLTKALKRQAPELPIATALLMPEVFSPAVAAQLPYVFRRTAGPRVALFHDAIALKLPELSPPKTVARFPAYLAELVSFDAVAAVSQDSRETLLAYWEWARIRSVPPVTTLPLPLPASAPHSETRVENPTAAAPVVLSVGTLEGRKNHLALLLACERLWMKGLRFELELAGLAHAETGKAAVAKVRELQAAGRPLRYHGPVTDTELEALYRRCTFTVYPSLMEGFGLPVLEALARGKPCICSNRGALGESADGGGCLTLDRVDTDALESALMQMLGDTQLQQRLTRQASARTFRTWVDYVDDLLGWLPGVQRRSP